MLIRHNGFVGRISYLAELEDKYRLGFGIPADKGEEVIVTLRRLLADEDRSARWATRRAAMLGDKIDVTEFFVSECVGVWR